MKNNVMYIYKKTDSFIKIIKEKEMLVIRKRKTSYFYILP